MLHIPYFEASVGLSALRKALLGTSALIAVSLASASPAVADCTPPADGIEPGFIITCLGSDTVGIKTSVSNLIINVRLGASVIRAEYGIFLLGNNYFISNAGTIIGGPHSTEPGDAIAITGDVAMIFNLGIIDGRGQDGLNLGFNDGQTLGTKTTLELFVFNDVLGTISGKEAAIRLNAPGRIVNNGTLSGEVGVTLRLIIAGTVENFGVINSTSHGIHIDRSNNLTVINHEAGVINSGVDWAALSNAHGNNNTLTNNGTIDSKAAGMLAANGTNITLINNGKITAAVSGMSTFNASMSKIENTGTIDAGEHGILIDSDTITVTNSGKIASDGIGILLFGRADGTIINNLKDGTISGDMFGIEIRGTATNTTINNAAGATISSILGGDGVETIINAGSLIGNVDLGAGDDFFTHDFFTGNVLGTVDGGDGFDTFGIIGTGIFAFPDWMINFEKMEVGVGTELVINPASGARNLDLSLSVAGTVTQISGTLNLIKFGAITVFGENATYVLGDGGVIAGTGPDAKFLLKDGAGLIIDSPGELFDPLGAKIDVPLETRGTTAIILLENAVLDIAKPGTYEGQVIFLLSKGSALSFSAPQTFAGKSEISSDFMSPISTSDTLTVKGHLLLSNVEFFLGGALDVTEGLVTIGPNTFFEWQKGVIEGGSLDLPFLPLEFGLLNKGNLIMGPGIPEGGFQLNGIILNEKGGEFLISHSLNLADQSLIRNEGSLFMEGNSAIQSNVNAVTLLTNLGLIRIVGVGTNAEIRIPVINQSAQILVTPGSTLTLRRTIDFNGPSTLISQEQGQIEFALPPGEKLTVGGILSFNGLGMVKVTDTDVVIKSFSELRVLGGSTTSVTTPDGDFLKGSSGWLIDGGTTLIDNGGAFIILSDGVLKWRKGTITGTGAIFNSGLMEIVGTGSHVLNTQLVNRKQLTISGSITGTGAIFNTFLGSTVILDKAGGTLDIGVFFSNTKKVIVNFGTDATFGEVLQLTDGTLSEGQWIVNDEASLTLTARSGSSDIHVIRDSARVELRGTGKLNNLTNVIGDLDIIKGSKLFFRDVASANVSGQLSIFGAGELRLFGSHLTVGGDLEMGSNFLDSFGLISQSTLVVDAGSKLTIRDQFEVLAGGIVNIDGVVTADSIDIMNGASFRGSGTINAQKFNNAGQLLAGSSPGILTINGNYTQTSTGVLQIEIGGLIPGTEYDQLIVNGIVTLEAGSTIEITMLDLNGGGLFEPRTGDVFDFLVASTLVLPAGSDISDFIVFINLPSGLRFDISLLDIDGMTVLQLFALFGINPDFLSGLNPQLAGVGAYVNSVLFDGLGSPATDAALADIAGLDDAGILSALANLHPEAYSASAFAAIDQATALSDMFSGRVDTLRSERRRRGIDLWLSGFGAFSNRDPGKLDGTSGGDFDSFGLVFGVDFAVDNDLILGALIGVTDSAQEFDGFAARTTGEGVLFGAYGAYRSGPWSLGAMGTYHMGELTTRRNIDAAGEAVRGEYDQDWFLGHGEVAYDLGEVSGLTITPQVELTYLSIKRDALTETGSDGLALQVDGAKDQFLFLEAIVTASGAFDLAGGTKLVPSFSIGYRFELLDNDLSATARFVGAAGAPFTVSGGELTSGRATIAAGLTAHLSARANIFISYEGEFGSRVTSHRLSGGFGLRF